MCHLIPINSNGDDGVDDDTGGSVGDAQRCQCERFAIEMERKVL